MSKETIMQALQRRMRESGATQTQIANATGIGQSTIGRILRGEVSPTVDVVQKIHDWLGPDKGKRRGRRPSYEVRA